MKKIIVLLLSSTVFFAACKRSDKEMIAKKWRAVKLESPDMDKKIHEQEMFLDTFGKNADEKTNEAIYGVKNIDSVRESLKAQLKDFKDMQEHSTKNTWFDFHPDGVVVMNFSGQLDSTNWYFDDEHALILDEMKLKGSGNKIKMVVKQLTDTSLKLEFNEEGMTSTVTFHPEKK